MSIENLLDGLEARSKDNQKPDTAGPAASPSRPVCAG